MGRVAHRRAGPAVVAVAAGRAGVEKSVLPPNAGAGRVAGELPAPRSKPVADAGMLYTAQRQKPLPLGASGSYTWSVNDCVPAGGFDQAS